MLLQGDPRVVESLFVDNAFVSSDEWKALCSRWSARCENVMMRLNCWAPCRRDEFLTLAVVRKYLSDAEGPQKLQLLRKRHAERTRESERHHKGRNGTSAGSVVVDSSRGSGASAPTEWTQRQKQRQRTELLGDSSSAAVSLGTGGSDSKSAEAASSPASSLMMELMDAKDAKLWYLVFRLLFHALDVVQLRTIRVWFAERPRGEPADSKAEVKEHSADEQYARRDLLLSIRAGNRTHEVWIGPPCVVASDACPAASLRSWTNWPSSTWRLCVLHCRRQDPRWHRPRQRLRLMPARKARLPLRLHQHLLVVHCCLISRLRTLTASCTSG